MSYALRNSLILGVLLLIVASLGAYWVGVRRAAHIERLQAELQKAQQRLNDINNVLAIYDTTKAQLDRLKARWQARKQIVPASDSPARTLVYLQEMLKGLETSLNYDFLFKGRKDNEGYSVNRYALEGEGRFEDLYTFIWRLENGRHFYTVDHLQIFYTEPEGPPGGPEWDWVDFRMVLRSYFEPTSRVEDLPARVAAARPEAQAQNPFGVLITRRLPANRQNLIEVDEVRLMGLTPTLAFIVDREGQWRMLREGDPVYLGRVDRIDIGQNLVEFELNLGGIQERYTLRVEMGAPQR